MGSRVAKEKISINYQSTLAFFDARGKKQFQNPLSATMYQDNQPELVAARDIAEKSVLTTTFDRLVPTRILDLGCGLGRWGWFFADKKRDISYLGIDFSANLIAQAQKIAVEKNYPALNYQVMSVTAIEKEKLIVAAPYDLIIISGVLLYLNDDDCSRVLDTAAQLCAVGGQIYIREPLGMSERLTLNNFYSQELNADYSAIYRSREEMQGMIESSFGDKEYSLCKKDFLFPEALEKRKETRQFFYIINKKVV